MWQDTPYSLWCKCKSIRDSSAFRDDSYRLNYFVVKDLQEYNLSDVMNGENTVILINVFELCPK